MKRSAPALRMALTCCTALASTLLTGTARADSPDQITVHGLFHLTYEDGESGGERFADFFVNRAYLTTEAEILSFLSGRITFDTAQDLEGQGRGDMEVRLKYALGKFRFGHWGPVQQVNLEAGIVHMVWLDFEEHINLYRLRGPMFMERVGIFNSADFGVTLAGGIGEELGEAFRQLVNSKYAARHGSFAVGLYNGSGYHGDERNTNKVFEARLTWRPLPELLPGLQVAGLAILGRGNLPEESGGPPNWRTYNAFVSYEHSRGALTAQYVEGEGNQQGTWIESGNPAVAQDYTGRSVFAELRSGPHWRLIGGYDSFRRGAGVDDQNFELVLAALGYDLGGQNIVMLDYERRMYDDTDRADDDRLQLVLQIKF